MKKILIATHNPGKISEYKVILKDWPIEIFTLKDLNIKTDPEEDGKTFEENAIKKAEYYSRLSDLPLIAEDSGLEIDYLKGEPGIHSRRWPGHKATDEELVEMALVKLKDIPEKNRGAQFRVVMAFKENKESKVITAEGILRGRITERIVGKIIPGFPFRSIFYIPEARKVLGELNMDEEAKIAHRRIALKKLRKVIEN